MSDSPSVLLDASIARLLWRAIVFADVGGGVAYVVDEKRKRHPVPKFSTDVDDARRLVRLMRSLGFKEVVRTSPGGIVCAYFTRPETLRQHAVEEAATKPLALSRAALSALSETSLEE